MNEQKKKASQGIALIHIVFIVVLVIVVVMLVKTFMGPKAVVKKYVKALNDEDLAAMYDCIDSVGMSTFLFMSEDDYDDFWEEYQEDLEEYEEEQAEDQSSYKISKIKSVEEVADHLYVVSAKMEITDSDGETETDTYDFYLVKKSGRYYIVGME